MVVKGRVVGDDVCNQINEMLSNELEEIASKDGGWTKLLRDTNQSYWQLTYPQSYLQGGGPPQLEAVKTRDIASWHDSHELAQD